MVVDIEGTQHRLTGTADAQYEEWRELLLQLYQSETGLVPEVDIYTEALSEVSLEKEAELLEESSKVKEGADSDGEVTTGV